MDVLPFHTHRIAISNERLTSLYDGIVTFAGRNNEESGPRKRHESFPVALLIQRFMQHVLPAGLKRIRHYGVLANCHKKAKLGLCRLALNAPQPAPVGI
jgi:Putative transposase